MNVGVVDYDAGNLRSVETALRHIGTDFVVSSDPDVLRRSDRLIFPGVGDAGAAMDVLNRSGLAEAIREFYRSGNPMLGICLGSQIVLEGSDETATPCLGLVKGRARLFPFSRSNGPAGTQSGEHLKVPHIGWNGVHPLSEDPLFSGIPDRTSFYFVHSYYPEPEEKSVLCTTDYGIEFAAGLRQENLWAVQFHPEKSGETGLQMLRNFLESAL